MVKEICHDPIILSRLSVPATAEDLQTALDLADTLTANREHCIGMAANMIGVNKRIIAVAEEADMPFSAGKPPKILIFFNPEIVRGSDPYETEEGCLSWSGTHKVKRYRTVKLRYCDSTMQSRLRTFRGLTAQIIQHEIDHCDGKKV